MADGEKRETHHIQLRFLNLLLHLRWRGPHEMPCHTAVHKGQELGSLEYGSAVFAFAPIGCIRAAGLHTGQTIRQGQALMQLPSST